MAAIKHDCRLLIDPPASGAWNMAIDEVLLESAARDGLATLRFYRWSEATLSLGYFQKFADRVRHVKSQACPVVRRSSGGGAIVHDQELTYSLAIPTELPAAANVEALYDAAHDSLMEALAAWGIRATKSGKGTSYACGDVPPGKIAAREEPFLCFERRVCGDVLLEGHKICGSAQRRHHGAILQHGSVLLGTSAAAPELAGLRELTGITLHENELVYAWQPRFAARLNVRAIPDALTPQEITAARELTISKHAADRWLQKR